MKTITRQRASLTCVNCQRRKVKCDRGQPRCVNCVKSNLRCQYTSRAKESFPERPHVAELLEDAASARTQTSDDHRTEIDALPTLRQQLQSEALEERVSPFPTPEYAGLHPVAPTQSSDIWWTRPSSQDSAGIGHINPNPARAETTGGDGVDGSSDTGKLLYMSPRKSTYISSQHWASSVGENEDLLKALGQQLSSTSIPGHISRTASNALLDTPEIQQTGSQDPLRTFLQQSEAEPGLPQPQDYLLDELPEKNHCDMLFRAFHIGCNVIHFIAQLPYLQIHYDEFFTWRSHQNERPYRNPTFIPLLWAMLYGGLMTLPQKDVQASFPGNDRMILARKFSDAVIISLKKTMFVQRPQLHGLMAYIIIETMTSRDEEPMVSQMSFSLIVRLAQMLGLHREPTQLDILNPAEVELRRRLWWHIVFLDSVYFTASGLPPVIYANSWNVRPIAEIKDPLLHTAAANKYLQDVSSGLRNLDECDNPLSGASSSFTSVALVLNRGKHIYAEQVYRLYLSHVNAAGSVATRNLLQELKRQLVLSSARIPQTMAQDGTFLPITAGDEYYRSVMDFFGMTAVEHMTDEEFTMHRDAWLGLHALAKIWLRMLYLQARCVFHRDLKEMSMSEDAIDNLAKETHAVATEYLQLFIEIVRSPLFQAFHWAWPGCHQPLHAIAILLMALYTRPQDHNIANCCMLIDTAFALSSADDLGICALEDGQRVARPLNHCGKSVWFALRNLRAETWRRLDLDPDVLWPLDLTSSTGLQGRASNDNSGVDFQAEYDMDWNALDTMFGSGW